MPDEQPSFAGELQRVQKHFRYLLRYLEALQVEAFEARYCPATALGQFFGKRDFSDAEASAWWSENAESVKPIPNGGLLAWPIEDQEVLKAYRRLRVMPGVFLSTFQPAFSIEHSRVRRIGVIVERLKKWALAATFPGPLGLRLKDVRETYLRSLGFLEKNLLSGEPSFVIWQFISPTVAAMRTVTDHLGRWAICTRDDSAGATKTPAVAQAGQQAPAGQAPSVGTLGGAEADQTDPGRMVTMGPDDYSAGARALLEIQAKCREWGEVLRRNGWRDDDTNTHSAAAQTPEAKAAELAIMGLIKKHEAFLTYCRNNFVRDPSTPLDRAFDYIGIYLARGPETLKHNPAALPECLTVEASQPNVPEPYREPTFIVQLGRWAQRLSELAASVSQNGQGAHTVTATRAHYAKELEGVSRNIQPVNAPTQATGGNTSAYIDPRKKRKVKWLAEAMILVRDHPDWSDAQVARQVKVDRSRLSRSPEYQQAAILARGGTKEELKEKFPKGRYDARTGQFVPTDEGPDADSDS